jgi:hypothetical protein
VSPLVAALLALLAAYALLVTWQMRRALAAPEGPSRLREATRLLGLVTLGVPLALALIFAS